MSTKRALREKQPVSGQEEQLFTVNQIPENHRTQPENFHQLHRLQKAFECGE